MNYTLILLKDGRNILVSDEEIIFKDWFYSIKYNIIDKLYSNGVINHKECLKIIARVEFLPTLTYSDEVKQQLRDKYGWVDVEELAVNFANKEIKECNSYHDLHFGFNQGFKVYQSITNKMFSLEDMNAVLTKMALYAARFGEDCLNKKDEIIQSLQQPIQLNVEVEMEEYTQNYHKDIWYDRPKITNNSILITKIIE